MDEHAHKFWFVQYIFLKIINVLTGVCQILLQIHFHRFSLKVKIVQKPEYHQVALVSRPVMLFVAAAPWC